jgi:hypothetical protein
MISFDAAHKTVHYPQDRRFRIWVRPSILIGIAAAIALLLFAAWIEFGLVGLPYVPPIPQVYPNNFAGPHGFPLWVRYCHFFNFLFVMMLIRSGLSILMDHPDVLQLSGLLAGDVKESRNDNPTRDLQMASDRTRPHSLCGTVVSSLFSVAAQC